MARRARVDAELVRRGLARSRQQAAELIDAGRVCIEGMPASKLATAVAVTSAPTVEDAGARTWVSRGAHKIIGALDAFGIHGIGGMIGAIGTAIVYAPSLGGPGDGSKSIGTQLVIQIEAVAVTILWAAIGTVIAITIAKLLTGLRVSEEVEREGLDLGEHGERAYHL